jgi:hypothetical protein
VEEAQVE